MIGLKYNTLLIILNGLENKVSMYPKHSVKQQESFAMKVPLGRMTAAHRRDPDQREILLRITVVPVEPVQKVKLYNIVV